MFGMNISTLNRTPQYYNDAAFHMYLMTFIIRIMHEMGT